MEQMDFSLGDSDSVTTEELDLAVKNMQDSREAYDQRKKLSAEAYHVYQKNKEQVLELLGKTGKSKYVVDGLGTVSVVDKLKVQTPKSNTEKEQFFKWLEEREGHDGFLAYATVNHNTLNSLYKRYVEFHAENGEEFTGIPGIGEPISEKEIRFRKG